MHKVWIGGFEVWESERVIDAFYVAKRLSALLHKRTAVTQGEQPEYGDAVLDDTFTNGRADNSHTANGMYRFAHLRTVDLIRNKNDLRKLGITITE